MTKIILLLNLLIPPGPVIALTFDDGLGTYYSNEVIKTLNKNKAKATFFPRGKSLFGRKLNFNKLRKNLAGLAQLTLLGHRGIL